MFRNLLLFTLLSLHCTAHAFQFADAESKILPSSPKCILYWGKQQCELTEANGYKNRLSVTASGFRQMLLQPPTIWNGSSLLRDFSFALEGLTVSTTNYALRLGELDAALNPKVVVNNLLQMGDLPLSEGLVGSVGILIVDPEEKEFSQYPRANGHTNEPFLDQNVLQQVVWGREDLTEISKRDFFTAAEFWQTLRFEPLVEWHPWAAAQPLRAIVSFQSPESGTFSLSALLSEENAYRAMLDNLNNYKYLAKPGSTVSLAIETAGQYEQLYKKPMRLVDDQAPQLNLRRGRDTHKLEIEWETFTATMEGLYLSSMPDGEHKTQAVDEPMARFYAVSRADSVRAEIFMAKPVCKVDGVEVPGFSFRVKAGDKYYELSDEQPFTQKIAKEIAFFSKIGMEFQLDSFALSGYTLPSMSYMVHFTSIKNSELVRNTFESLMAATSATTLATLLPPVVDDEAVEVTFRIPKEVNVKISLYDPSGWLVQIMADKYPAGEHKVRLPHGLARMSGKHYVFLNTPFGVMKQEVVLK